MAVREVTSENTVIGVWYDTLFTFNQPRYRVNRLTRLVSHLAVGTTFAVALPAASSAQTITFDGLSGPNGNAFLTYAETGYTISLYDGDLNHAFLAGNDIASFSSFHGGLLAPARSRGGSSHSGEVETSRGGGAGARSSTFSAYLASVAAFLKSGNSAITWESYSSTPQSSPVDELQSILDPGSSSSNEVDHLALAAAATVVPEPSTVLLMAGGMLGLIAVQRRRRA